MTNYKTTTDERAAVASRLSSLFKETIEAHELYQRILDLAGELVISTSRALFLHYDDNRPLREVAASGRKSDLIEFVPFELGTGLSAWVAKEKRPVKIARIGRRSHESSSCFLAVPLLTADELVGVMTFANEEREFFSDEDVVVAESMAAQIAAALEQQLHRQQALENQHRTAALTEEMRSVRSQLDECRSELVRSNNALLLVDKMEGSLAVARHVIDYLNQEYRTRDARLIERLSVLGDEIGRIGILIERVQNLSSRNLLAGDPQKQVEPDHV